MTETPPPTSGAASLDHPPTDHDRTARVMVMVVYGLYLLALPLPVVPALFGVVLAYSARGATRPPWRGHFDDAIATFWLCLLMVLIGAPLLAVYLIGVIPMVAAAALLVFKAGRGLIRAHAWLGV